MPGRVHLLTDSRPGADPVAQVAMAASVAASSGSPDLVIQFRSADEWSDRKTYDLAREIMRICAPAGIPLLVNDRVHVALAVDAQGVHVGAEDLPVAVARKLLGPGRIVGATARDAAQGRQAIADGADYLGVGPCYRSSTKDGLPDPLGAQGVRPVAELGVPVVGIGGITAANAGEVLAHGAHGIAVIAAVSQAADPAAALAELLALVAAVPPAALWPLNVPAAVAGDGGTGGGGTGGGGRA